MRKARCRVAGLMMALAVALPASAQFGHPLKGSWTGDWGTSKENRTHVVLELNWDGKAITGTINPGPNGVRVQKASLDPETWAVHLEADGKDLIRDSVLDRLGKHLLSSLVSAESFKSLAPEEEKVRFQERSKRCFPEV